MITAIIWFIGVMHGLVARRHGAQPEAASASPAEDAQAAPGDRARCPVRGAARWPPGARRPTTGSKSRGRVRPRRR
jgi:hypothetical protein